MAGLHTVTQETSSSICYFWLSVKWLLKHARPVQTFLNFNIQTLWKVNKVLLIAWAHENAFNFLMNGSYILSFFTWCCFIYASKVLYSWTLCNATVWICHRNVSLQYFCPHYGLIVVLRRKYDQGNVIYKHIVNKWRVYLFLMCR